MGLLHRKQSRLRLRDRSIGLEKRMRCNTANELGHRQHHRRRDFLRLQPARRPMELEDASSAPMDLPRKSCPPTKYSQPTPFPHPNQPTYIDPPPRPPLLRPRIPLVAHPPRPQRRSLTINQTPRLQHPTRRQRSLLHDGAHDRD
jgi:hypothetical protein